MALYSARQRERDGRWDMTCQNSAGTFAIGYCHARQPLKAGDADGLITAEMASHDNAKFAPVSHKFHADGHATADDAHTCWLNYRLDTELEFHHEADEQHRCAVCREWCQTRAILGREFPRAWWVCATHAARAAIATLESQKP